MVRKFSIFIIIIAILVTGCTMRQPELSAVGLIPVSSADRQQASLADNIVEQGQGNSYRVVACANTNERFVELAAGGSGQLEYFCEVPAAEGAQVNFKLQFLSTQGLGRIRLEALDQGNQVIQSVGWVVTGVLPANTANAKWIDARYSANYQGNWLQATYNLQQILAQQFPESPAGKAARYRFSIEAGQGQHVLIANMDALLDKRQSVKVVPQTVRYSVELGAIFNVEADIVNIDSQPVTDITAKLVEPYGYGLIVETNAGQQIDSLAPGEKKHLVWQVKAQRPDSVNLNKPWQFNFSINGAHYDAPVSVAVSDPRPGTVFYVMTDDLEPIDSAGYPTAWGNANGWLDPQEFMVQMVRKAEKLNAIAEQYGAKWTHYIAWPAVKAAEWAAAQSATGKWSEAVVAIKSSVREQAKRGHEYGIHLHSDYDPYLPGNVLSYNQATDGFWANHLRHGWAHSVASEGDFGDRASRSGILYSYQLLLDELEADSSQGQLLTARAGSFDFGNGSADEAMSTRVYKKVGLWGSSDADGNVGGLTAGSYGSELYFTAPDDINSSAADLKNTGIVEFRPTPKQCITYDSQSAAVMNAKTDQGMACFLEGKAVKPGVHAIIGFTHAMFVMGRDGWQSTDDGQFKAIASHLAYVRQQYADKGLVSFATASELVAHYLDYYTPQPVAVYGQRLAAGVFASEYSIKVLGRDIPIDTNHVHSVSMKYPLYLRDSAYCIRVLKDGRPIYTTWGLPTPFNDIQFTVDDYGAQYTLKVYHSQIIYTIVSNIRSLKQKVLKNS